MNIKGISSWWRQKEIIGEKSIFIVKNYKLRVRDASTLSNERCLFLFLSLKKPHAYARVCVSLNISTVPSNWYWGSIQFVTKGSAVSVVVIPYQTMALSRGLPDSLKYAPWLCVTCLQQLLLLPCDMLLHCAFSLCWGRDSWVGDDWLVITKGVGWSIKWYTKHSQLVTKCFYHVNHDAHHNKFRAKCWSLHCTLCLGEPNDWCTIQVN